jgi:DNA-binding MurR/RpiR family transcriptional regulator
MVLRTGEKHFCNTIQLLPKPTLDSSIIPIMASTANITKAAVVQAEPVWFDLAGTTAKTCDLIKEAASKGAQIIAFPELWLPGYPTWIW